MLTEWKEAWRWVWDRSQQITISPNCVSLFILLLNATACPSDLHQGKSYIISLTHTNTHTQSYQPHPSTLVLSVRPSVYAFICICSEVCFLLFLVLVNTTFLPACSGQVSEVLAWQGQLCSSTWLLQSPPPLPPPLLSLSPPPSFFSSPTFPFRPLSFSFHLPSSHTAAGHGSTFTVSWTKGRLASSRMLRTPVRPTTTSPCSTCPTATATSPTATKRRRMSSHWSESLFW